MMNFIYIWLSVMVIHALFYIMFPNLPADTGNYFMLFSALGWCIFALISYPLYKFINTLGKYFGFLSVVVYYILLFGFLGIMQPQADGRSPFEQILNGNFPTSTTMKSGFTKLRYALTGLQHSTNQAVKKGMDNVSIDAIEKAVD